MSVREWAHICMKKQFIGVNELFLRKNGSVNEKARGSASGRLYPATKSGTFVKTSPPFLAGRSEKGFCSSTDAPEVG